MYSFADPEFRQSNTAVQHGRKEQTEAILGLSAALYRNVRQHFADDQDVEMHVSVPVSMPMGLCADWTR